MKAAAESKSRPKGTAAERLRLFIVEAGSSALSGARSDDFDQTLAITQMRGEHPRAFAQRAAERIAAVERSGRCFDSAVVLTGARHDAEALAARRELVMRLAAHARQHAAVSELLLEASSSVDSRGRQALLTLVEELLAGSQARPVPVRLRFDDSRPAAPPADSGVSWSLA